MAYDGKVKKSLNERAKEYGVAMDTPDINRKERRKEAIYNIKEEKKKLAIREGRIIFEEKPEKLVHKGFCGSKKKYLAALKEKIKEKMKEDGTGNG